MTAVTIYDPSKTHFYVQLEEDITRILVTSEDKTIDEVKKTSSDFKVFIAAIQAKFVVLVKENQKLSELLIASKSRVREITVLHTEVLSVIKEDIDLKKRELLTIQQEMIAYVQKAKEHINKEIDAKIKAIEAAHQAGKVRESTAHQDLKDAQLQLKTIIDEDAEQAIVKLTEKDAAVQAAEQTGAAKLAAVQQEEDALRRDIANLKKSHADKLAAEIALQASDTIRMQQFCDQFTIVSNWHANLSHRAVGINYIHYELKNLNLNLEDINRKIRELENKSNKKPIFIE